MKIIENVAGASVEVGLGLWAGFMLFSPGSLSIIGLFIFVPIFVGTTGKLALRIYHLLPEAKPKDANDTSKVNADEKNGNKPDVEVTA